MQTKWVTQQWVARGLAGSPAPDPIAAALAGGLPTKAAAPLAVAPARRRQQPAPEEPATAELLLAGRKAGKKGKGKQQGSKPGRGFGAA